MCMCLFVLANIVVRSPPKSFIFVMKSKVIESKYRFVSLYRTPIKQYSLYTKHFPREHSRSLFLNIIYRKFRFFDTRCTWTMHADTFLACTCKIYFSYYILFFVICYYYCFVFCLVCCFFYFLLHFCVDSCCFHVVVFYLSIVISYYFCFVFCYFLFCRGFFPPQFLNFFFFLILLTRTHYRPDTFATPDLSGLTTHICIPKFFYLI